MYHKLVYIYGFKIKLLCIINISAVYTFFAPKELYNHVGQNSQSSHKGLYTKQELIPMIEIPVLMGLSKMTASNVSIHKKTREMCKTSLIT